MDMRFSKLNNNEINKKFSLIINGKINKFKSYIELNPHMINTIGDHNITPLLCALENNQEELAQYLIYMGAQTNVIETLHGYSTLHYTAISGYIDIYNLIMEINSTCINVKDFYGNTPLITACIYGHYDIVIKLIEHGANINEYNYFQQTALYYACENNNSLIVSLLLNNNAIIDCQNNLGLTPLMVACKNELIDIVNILLENGSNVNITNNSGFSALDLAKQTHNDKIIILLNNRGIF